MNNFDKWDKVYRSQNIKAFNCNSNGLLWLKVRAICRSKQISQFIAINGIHLHSVTISEMNKELFEYLEKRKDAMLILDKYLTDLTHEWYYLMNIDIEQLKEDLYKIQYYSWGGDQNNSLDRYFVNRYVKTISNFSELQNKRGEIANNAWDYVQNSWYNNWTSFLIESLFKLNPKVISAVGEIKSVDFFIGDYPIDLKVTFFPSQYMYSKLQEKLGRSVLSWLRRKAKTLGISSNTKESTSQQIYTLSSKLYEQGHVDIIADLNKARQEVIYDAQNNPIELMTWLYENQGELRFGAENRLYLILADTVNYNESWKMKRAISLIEPKVSDYLKNFSNQSLKQIDFIYHNQAYSSMADAIFVLR